MAIFQVKISPNASKNSLEGWRGEILRIRLHVAPEKGKANEELVSFLSEEFGVAKSDIRIISGKASRLKKIEVRGKTIKEIEKSHSR